MNANPRTLVIIPAYNEEASLYAGMMTSVRGFAFMS